jgi:hypothetical protein
MQPGPGERMSCFRLGDNMVDGGEKLRMYLAEFNDGAKYLTRVLAGKMPLVYYLAQKSD